MRDGWRCGALLGALGLLGLGPAPEAAAQPITANDFRIDALATPVLGGSRIVGLGGAFTALAEGIDGVPYNPAGYAARFAYENDWYEYEISAGVQLAGAFTDVDYFLNGQGSGLGVSGFYGANVTGRLQFAQLGLGGSLQVETFDVGPDIPVDVTFTRFRVGGGYNLLDGQLAVGGGALVVQMTLDHQDDPVPLVDFTGVGVEAGAVLRMTDRRWRVGLMARTAVNARVIEDDADPMGVQEQGGFVLPISVNLPWEVRAGFAWQFLERPFNPRFAPPKNVKKAVWSQLRRRWCARERRQALREAAGAADGAAVDTDTVGSCPRLRRGPRDEAWWEREHDRREAERAQAQIEVEQGQESIAEIWDEMEASRARRYLLVSADLRILGRVPDGIGVDAFIAQNRVRRGENVNVGVHLGAEAEPWPRRLKVRAGVYYEPARYRGVRGRLHGTVGFDFRVFEIWGAAFRAGFYVDGARDWVNWGISIGGWH